MKGKGVKFVTAAALMMLPLAAPMTAYAADSGTTTAAPTSSTNGLAVSGDVVMSGICQVAGEFHAGDMMVFRAQVLESDGSAINPDNMSVTTNLADGTTVKMAYHGENMWVGTYVIPANAKLGALPYTISAKDSAGHTGTFVPLGIPPMVVDDNVTFALNGTPIGKTQIVGATVQLYPIIQLLKKEGLKVGWNGHALSITNPAFPALPDMGGKGPYSVVINGKTVYRTTGQVMKDSYTHNDTTYVSTDIFGFLVDISNRAATFAGNVFNVSTSAATAGGSK